MIITSIIPIWLMIIISVIAIIFIVKTDHRKNNLIRKILIILLVFIINLRIMFPSGNVQTVTNNLDVLFVIDNTISSLAEDYQGNKTRLEGIKEECKYIINNLGGSRFSVMTFSDTSQIKIPYTKDTNITLESIETINPPNQYYARGSTLNIVLDDMVKQLEASSKKQGRKTIIFFVSDGEITNEDKLKSFSSAQKYVDNGAVLGFGTSKGGNMKAKNYDDKEEYLKDYTSMDYPIPKAVSKIDENNLKQIAKDIGIDYIHIEKVSDIDYKLKEIAQKLEEKDFDNSSKNAYVDTYYIFTIPLLGLLVFEFINYKRKL